MANKEKKDKNGFITYIYYCTFIQNDMCFCLGKILHLGKILCLDTILCFSRQASENNCKTFQ